MKIFTVAEMVAAEKTADSLGTSYATMMETAGKGVADIILQQFSPSVLRVLILVGAGNNGGDGLVAGRHLAQAGADVAFYLTHSRDPETDSNFAQLQQMGLNVIQADFDQRFRVLRTRLASSNLLIDALLGTGVSRPIKSKLAQLMQQVKAGVDALHAAEAAKAAATTYLPINAPNLPTPNQPITIVAVDCPSGLNCDTGALDPLAIPADITVTFQGPKRGHFRFPGAAACGQIQVVDLQLPPAATQAVRLALFTAQDAAKLLPPRPMDGHKGTFGKVLILSGSADYWGAPLLAGKAAFRAGSGLVALGVPRPLRPSLVGQLPEATYPLLPEGDQFGAETAVYLHNIVHQYDALLVGPGIGDVPQFMAGLLTQGSKLPPLVLDADALNWLATQADWPKLLPPDTVLTPHPGEMARLMGISLGELKQQDRVTVAQAQAKAWNCVVLLKGAFTVVAAPDGRVAMLPFANPALAVAGSGDTLAGILVSLRGQGLDGWETAVLGAFLHGAAAQQADKPLGLLPSELADTLAETIRFLQ